MTTQETTLPNSTQALVAAAAAAADAAATGIVGATDGPLLAEDDLTAQSTVEVEEITTVNVDLPLALLMPAQNDPRAKWTVQLYKRDCLMCPALVPWAEDEYEDVVDVATATCHHHRGNALCPAAQIRFEALGVLHKMTQSLIAAQAAAAAGDPMKLNEVITKINTMVVNGKLSKDDLSTVYRKAGLIA